MQKAQHSSSLKRSKIKTKRLRSTESFSHRSAAEILNLTGRGRSLEAMMKMMKNSIS